MTLGLSLTIPLAVVGDLARGTQIGGISLLFGAILVLAGFVAVGWADYKETQTAVEESEEHVSGVLSDTSMDGTDER